MSYISRFMILSLSQFWIFENLTYFAILQLMVTFRKFIKDSQFFLERVDVYRDKVVLVGIRPFWPGAVTPNHLTFLRIVIGIFLIFSLFVYQKDNPTLIIPLFFVGMLTDLLDGSIARGYNKITKIGTILDPIADRILIIPIAFYSLIQGHQWLLLILLLLEIINSLLSVYGQLKGTFIQSNIYGKVKMFFHSFAFLGILVAWPKALNLFFVYLLWVSVIIMTVSIYVKFLEVKNLSKNA